MRSRPSRRRISSTASAIRTASSASSPTGPKVPSYNNGAMGPWAEHARLPDHWGVIEAATEEHPFRLATSPARNFLNSTFTETPTSLDKERRPEVMIHPVDAAAPGHRRRRLGEAAEPSRRGLSARQALRRRAARRADRRGHLAQRRPSLTGAASTRSPAPIRSRPMAAPPSTTTGWRWKRPISTRRWSLRSRESACGARRSSADLGTSMLSSPLWGGKGALLRLVRAS